MITRQAGSVSGRTTQGVVFVYSTPASLCPHIEWAIDAVLGSKQQVTWKPQPAQRDTVRTELSWTGSESVAADLASRLLGMRRLRFEVTQDPAPGVEGHRYAYTPSLGLFTAATGANGDITVPEERLKQAVLADAMGEKPLSEAIADLLGSDWDAELDIFRHASQDSSVLWLHRAG